jgi:methylthioribose-1-phosphate isomerase
VLAVQVNVVLVVDDVAGFTVRFTRTVLAVASGADRVTVAE